MSKRAVVRTVVGFAFGAFLLWPVTTLNCPRWEILVVDKNGAPLGGMTVRLDYQNYSAEDNEHEVTLITDDRGYVVFPAQNLTTPRWRRLRATLKSAGAGVHASSGPHAWAFTSGKGLEGDAIQGEYVMDWKGDPPEVKSQIIAEPREQ